MLLNRSTHLLTREGKVEMTPERREELARVNMELSMEACGYWLSPIRSWTPCAPSPWRMRTALPSLASSP